MLLSYIRVQSLSAGSPYEIMCWISTPAPWFYFFLLLHRAAAESNQKAPSLASKWWRNAALITDLVNEAIDEYKYQISYGNDHATEREIHLKKQKKKLFLLGSSEVTETMNASEQILA